MFNLFKSKEAGMPIKTVSESNPDKGSQEQEKEDDNKAKEDKNKGGKRSDHAVPEENE